MSRTDGATVVLTADRSLMAGYDLLFDGMLVASQTTTTPRPILSSLLMPACPLLPDGRARLAPLGLRRIEAALLRSGFARDEVVVAPPGHLDDVIGPSTRVVGIATGEPAGRGMNSSTMVTLSGGMIYPQKLFREVLAEVRSLVERRAPGACVVIGGPGAWQLRNDADRRSLGVDHVVVGYAESCVGAAFRAIVDGGSFDEVLPAESVDAADIPAIVGASTMGVVEISRGCGLGCQFCTIAHTPMQHLPSETILSDVRTNVAAGQPNVALLSEDLLRYGGRGFAVDPGALVSLLRAVRAVPGVGLIQVDHANVASVARYGDADLSAVHTALATGPRHEFVWINVGVETASGRLLRANGGGPKMAGCSDDEWGELCRTQVTRLCRAGFFPLVSLVIGLPGETDQDVERTIDWVRSVSGERLSLFPMLCAPTDDSPAIDAREMSRNHWRLIRACYHMNFRWVPHMYWDNQTGAGVPLWRRMALQALGRGQVLQYNALFAWKARGAR